ncbi:hypothetical protein Tco_0069595, partial [Tanacetum coccineum]
FTYSTDMGLGLHPTSFIWVIRFPEGTKTSVVQVLPYGFLGRIGERGMVIENGNHMPKFRAMRALVDLDADERLKREDMAIVVRNMVVGGGHMREKVKELGEIVRKQGDEDLDMVVINSLVKLCEPKN